MILENGEYITDVIEHKNYIPFRQEDWVRALTIPFAVGGICIIYVHPIFIGSVFPASYFIFDLIRRWIKIRHTKYYLTDSRFIIYDSNKNHIKHSFYYNDFPKMTLRENAYNYGFIILGETEELIEGHETKFRFPLHSGFNLKDHKVVIDNIPNVRKVMNLIQSKITS